jgi:hypothetical protein
MNMNAAVTWETCEDTVKEMSDPSNILMGTEKRCTRISH